MDCNYVIIRAVKKRVELCFFSPKRFNQYNIYPICFTEDYNNINSMFNLISLCDFFHSLSSSHKLYIGMELFKATLCIKLLQSYIQE